MVSMSRSHRTGRFLSCQQAADYLGISVKTIRRWAQLGMLEGKKIGSRGDWRFTYPQLDVLVRTKNIHEHNTHTRNVQEKHTAVSFADATQKKSFEGTEQYFSALTSNIADAVVSLDMRHNVVSWNIGAEKLYGWKEEEVLGKKLSSLLRQKPVEGITLKELRQIVANTGVWRGESVHSRKDGSRVEVQTSVAAIKNSKGKMVGRVAVYRDITDRKRAERLLEEKETRYRLLFDSIVAGFCVVEALYDKRGRANDYRFLEANPAYQEMVGVSDMQGKTLQELSSAVSEKWLDVVADVVASGKDTHSITYSYSTDRYFDVHVMHVGAQGSRLAAMLVYDITERVKMEEERTAYSQKIINTLETIGEAFIQIDGDFNVVMVNEEFVRMTKIPREKALGHNLNDLFRVDKQTQIVVKETLMSVMKNQQHMHFSEHFYAPLKIWIEIRAYPAEQGGTSLFIRNITRQKQIEKKQALLKQLSLERDELIKLGHIKDEFIGIASHQLRTPATGVKQYVGILLAGIGGPLTEKQQKYLEEAYASNERQLKIINDLLKTAQIDADTYTLSQSRQNIALLINETIASLRSLFDTKQQSVDMRIECEDAMADVDPTEMDLVFSNLLENASKYSPPNSKIIVTVRCDKGTLFVAITDEGIGIREADQHDIFKKFTRVYNAQTDGVSGSGLGLYWVQQIVQKHYGTISVTSKLHEGSTFTVALPCVPKE